MKTQKKPDRISGNGIDDDTAAIQWLFDRRGIIEIPAGVYRLTKTLRIHSNTHLIVSPNARFLSDGHVPKQRGDFLLTNANPEGGDFDISITGGIWDGDNTGPCHKKDPNLFNPDAWSGTLINFFNVRDLHLADMTLANSVVYFTRFCRITDFSIRDIRFASEQIANNQDGLHFAGFVTNGIIENIRAVTKGQTNDDLIALNADDSIVRLENLDLVCGPIENLTFRNLYAEDCHTAIRILSIDSPIRNIHIENVVAGCRAHAINMDGARDCRTPLFREEERPQGSGCLENIEIRNLRVHATQQGKTTQALIAMETQANNFRLINFKRDYAADCEPTKPTLIARNLVRQQITIDGQETLLTNKSDRLETTEAFSALAVHPQ